MDSVHEVTQNKTKARLRQNRTQASFSNCFYFASHDVEQHRKERHESRSCHVDQAGLEFRCPLLPECRD